MTFPFDDFMRFGVVGYAAEELRVRSEPAAEESGSLTREKAPAHIGNHLSGDAPRG